MATPITIHLLLIFTIILVFSFPLAVTALRMNVYHVDSLLPKNLTDEERFIKLWQRRPRILSLPSIGKNSSSIHALRPPITKNSDAEYVVEVGIGTPPNPRLFFLDSGSEYIWMQCAPCTKCYTQTVPFFDPADSSTFKSLPCNHRYCTGLPCVNGRCEYLVHYPIPADTQGYLFSDTMTFASNGPDPEVRDNIIMGCSFKTDDFGFKSDVSGILGLNMNPRSVYVQLIGKDLHYFGFCLPRYVNNQQPPGYLKFGIDARMLGPDVRSVSFQTLDVTGQLNVMLLDISVADHRIGFPEGTFDLKSDENGQYGGFVIDTGTSESLFEEEVYAKLRPAFEAYFEPFHLPRFYNKRFDVCYNDPDGKFDKFPTMTFHFVNVDLVIPQEKVVIHGVGYFCVAINSLGRLNVLGVLQLTDINFAVDIAEYQLTFRPGGCTN